MNIEQISVESSDSLQRTFAIAEGFASRLSGGDVVELKGDLGAGKTAFVRGLASALGSQDEVASPSFTLRRDYRCRDDRIIHHYDFYRLHEPGLMRAELEESVGDPFVITLVEWGDTMTDVLPAGRYIVEIKAPAPEERVITISKGSRS